jgi:hypothetical protein
LAIEAFNIETPWTYVIAALTAAAWVIALSMKIVERKVDPFVD